MKHSALMDKAVKSFHLFTWIKGKGKVHTTWRRNRRRFLSYLRACAPGKYAVKVVYTVPGLVNESDWTTSKKELIKTMKAFTHRWILEYILKGGW